MLEIKPFLNEDFLLQTETARRLYHDFAKDLPIIDYHCHLSPKEIAEDLTFKNLTHIWLHGDHYKWRAMRANGVDEAYCTGEKSDAEKFEKWAETVPYTLRNPLYHWTHLELQRYFDTDEILSPKTAKNIYENSSAQLQQPGFSVHGLLKKFKVETVCTTDDPLDDLAFHKQIKQSGCPTHVRPTFRADKAMNTDDIEALNAYINRLSQTYGRKISTYQNYLEALKTRHDYFAENGCRLSDHGLEHLYADDFTEAEVNVIFQKIRAEEPLSDNEISQFKSAMLYQLAIWDWEKDWVQQFHIGALRNNNSRLLNKLGPDTGWDSIGDFAQGKALSKFLRKLDDTDQLAKTIIYNLNPADNELIAAMCGNFNDGAVAGKIQFGSGWWFLDQKDGMVKQMNALSNMGLLSRFVGMLTDSRSFMSFPRHEYFRRILCNLLGDDVHNGELPNNLEWLGKVVQDICYYNAKNYFRFDADTLTSTQKTQNPFA